MRFARASVVMALAGLAAVVLPAPASTGRIVHTERIQGIVEPAEPDAVIEAPTPLTDQPPAEEEAAPTDEPVAPVEEQAAPAQPLPEILRDPSLLPEPVRVLREKLMAAARTGDLEQLRPIIAASPTPPVLSHSPIDDPIDYLRSISGDPEGREILAILLEVMEAGFVHVDVGTEQEMYIWPYYARYPIDAYTPEQMVELFTLLTAFDFEEMKDFGAYKFFRVGISPDGTWDFFVADD